MPNYQDWDCRRIEVNQIRLYRTVVYHLSAHSAKVGDRFGLGAPMWVIIERLVLVFATPAIRPAANGAIWRIVALRRSRSERLLALKAGTYLGGSFVRSATTIDRFA